MIERLRFLSVPEVLSLDGEHSGTVRLQVQAAEDAEVSLRLEVEMETPGAPAPADWPRVEITAGGEVVPQARGVKWSWVGPPGSGRALRVARSTRRVSLTGGTEHELSLSVRARSDFSGRIRLLLDDGPRGWTASPWVARDPAALTRLRRLLPGAYQAAVEQSPQGALAALLEVTHGLLAPVDRRIRAIPELLSADRAPAEFVPLLAAWLATGASDRDALPPNREWVRQAARIAQSRGTAEGLLLTLRVATGVQEFALTEDPGQFHLRVLAPVHLRGLEGALRSLIERQRPAHMTYSLEYVTPAPNP